MCHWMTCKHTNITHSMCAHLFVHLFVHNCIYISRNGSDKIKFLSLSRFQGEKTQQNRIDEHVGDQGTNSSLTQRNNPDLTYLEVNASVVVVQISGNSSASLAFSSIRRIFFTFLQALSMGVRCLCQSFQSHVTCHHFSSGTVSVQQK